MSRIFLVTNPSDDIATQYLGSWMELVVNLAKKQPGIVIFSLDQNNANKEKLAEAILKEQPQLIIFNGHGTSECITGFNQEILIKCGENTHLLAERIIHSMSCDSAKMLGPECISIGAQAYIGYKEKFKFMHLNGVSHETRLNDGVANFCLQPAFEAVIALIEGSTVQEAYERSQAIYLENLRILITSKNTDYNTVMASQVYHDMINQVSLGTREASF